MVVENTIDEVIASRLEEKINDINTLIKPGQTDEKMQTALGDYENWIDNVGKQMETFVEPDEYLEDYIQWS